MPRDRKKKDLEVEYYNYNYEHGLMEESPRVIVSHVNKELSLGDIKKKVSQWRQLRRTEKKLGVKTTAFKNKQEKINRGYAVIDCFMSKVLGTPNPT